MPIFMKSGNLKLLEPSGSVQACTGTALPLPITHELKGTYYLCSPSFC